MICITTFHEGCIARACLQVFADRPRRNLHSLAFQVAKDSVAGRRESLTPQCLDHVCNIDSIHPFTPFLLIVVGEHWGQHLLYHMDFLDRDTEPRVFLATFVLTAVPGQSPLHLNHIRRLQ